MIKLYTLLFFSFLTIGFVQAQDFSDDFESFSVGDYIGSESSNWTTWSGSTGNAEDATVNADQSLSGSNSIHFVSTSANGGPQDVVLPFGQKYTSGLFTFEIAVNVASGAGAYWNFQAETAIGTTWAHNCFLLDSGEIQFNNIGSGLGLGASYQFDTWNIIKYDINLDTDVWTISLNGECLGSFLNEGADVASLDIYPVTGNDFYIDDVSFSHTEDVPERQYDASVNVGDLGAGGLTGMMAPITATITNRGEQVIESAEIVMTSPSGSETYTVENIAIAKGASTDFEIPGGYELLEGSQEISLEVISLNNGNVDEDPCNSRSSNSLLGATPAEGKGVLIEEGTGTWCGFCPRGTVFLDILNEKYGDMFVSVAVHNGDPMVVSGYDGQHDFDGYPQAIVDREVLTGFPIINDLELPFLQSISEAPAGTFELEGTYDVTSRVLNLNNTLTANEDLTTGHAIGLILVEGHVTGSGNGWPQENYYAGGGRGPMGGYESLPGSITNEVFQHVARAIPLGFDGQALTSNIAGGGSESYDYSITLDDEWAVTEMDVVLVLINPDGTVDNSYKVAMTELFITNTSDSNPLAKAVTLYPNPTTGDITIEMTTTDLKDIDVRVVDMLGQTVLTDRFTSVGSSQHTLKVDDLVAGSYYTVLTSGTQTSIVQFTKD